MKMGTTEKIGYQFIPEWGLNIRLLILFIASIPWKRHNLSRKVSV